MSRTDRQLVRDALDHITALYRHLARNDLADETVADAVSLRLAAAIESISETGVSMRTRLFGDDWKVIWATRNRIAHGYAFIDIELVRATVEHDLPGFERTLRSFLDES